MTATTRARLEGARIGVLLSAVAVLPGVVAALGGGSPEWWLLASLPAGAAAGAVAAPTIQPGRHIALRTIASAAAIAFLLGDGVVCLGLVVLYAPGSNWSLIAALPNTVALCARLERLAGTGS